MTTKKFKQFITELHQSLSPEMEKQIERQVEQKLTDIDVSSLPFPDQPIHFKHVGEQNGSDEDIPSIDTPIHFRHVGDN
jgi:hypothetical protein